MKIQKNQRGPRGQGRRSMGMGTADPRSRRDVAWKLRTAQIDDETIEHDNLGRLRVRLDEIVRRLEALGFRREV